jgi:hypothetical protein
MTQIKRRNYTSLVDSLSIRTEFTIIDTWKDHFEELKNELMLENYLTHFAYKHNFLYIER